MTCIAPMPALEMKRKSSTASVIGNHLHPCCKLKCVRSQVKTSQQTAALDNSFQSPNHAYPNIEIYGEDVENNKVKNCPDKLSEASSQLRKLPSLSSPDRISSGRKGSLSAACTSDLETIFSPNLEQEGAQSKMIAHADAANDEHTELPPLVPDDSDDGSCSPRDFPSYSELDFFNFEDLSTSQFNRDMGFTAIMDTIYTDFECFDPDTVIDMADGYMILPFLEKRAEASSIQQENSVDGTMMNSDDACLYLAIHQMSPDQDSVNSHFDDTYENECIGQQAVFKDLPVLSEAISSSCPTWIQKETRERKAMTLVLDLDETLVHSTLEHCDDADFSFPVFFNLKEHTVYVRRRPYLQMFLERVAQMFEIVVFTASQSIYAEQLLDILDPGKNLISHRIYRESCIFSDGNYTKDLTVLGIDLAKVAIVDNSPQVFRLQQDNGIPIKSWFDDPTDSALISLLPFLETLVDADDVRPIIAKKFGGQDR